MLDPLALPTKKIGPGRLGWVGNYFSTSRVKILGKAPVSKTGGVLLYAGRAIKRKLGEISGICLKKIKSSPSLLLCQRRSLRSCKTRGNKLQKGASEGRSVVFTRSTDQGRVVWGRRGDSEFQRIKYCLWGLQEKIVASLAIARDATKRTAVTALPATTAGRGRGVTGPVRQRSGVGGIGKRDLSYFCRKGIAWGPLLEG